MGCWLGGRYFRHLSFLLQLISVRFTQNLAQWIVLMRSFQWRKKFSSHPIRKCSNIDRQLLILMLFYNKFGLKCRSAKQSQFSDSPCENTYMTIILARSESCKMLWSWNLLIFDQLSSDWLRQNVINPHLGWTDFHQI